MITDVFKIQVAITSNQDNPPALVYNQSRSVDEFIPVEQVAHLFQHNQNKIFARADYSETEGFSNWHKMPWQVW